MRFFAFWCFIKMNILIVGNGFDLSHYLPTKYDHFMVAMEAIENWDVSKGDMSFDNLFSALYEKEDYFFGYTKAMYKTDELKISVDQIKELQEKLKDNVWYQYFSDHVREVKTWIDFETKIEDALIIIGHFFNEIENYQLIENNLSWSFLHKLKSAKEGFNLSQKKIRILELLGLIEVSYSSYDHENDTVKENLSYTEEWDDCQIDFLGSLIKEYRGYNEFLFSEAGKGLYKNLKNLSWLFNYYLNLVGFSQNSEFNSLFSQDFDKVYSFNYTSTFKNIYGSNANFYYLHGQANESDSTVVLGVSDLDVELLKKYNFWGFTKYHQKLLLNTDYNFLEEFLLESKDIQLEVDLTQNFWLNRTINGSGSVKYIRQKVERVLQERSLDINFYIWGHSLDYSDNAYVKELFSFNEPYDQGVKIVVYYYEGAQFDLLANLIYILKKDKVENWMKKGWLKFEKNPDIAKINGIEPVELPKMAAQAS